MIPFTPSALALVCPHCDELRGGMDASQYKDHVLMLLFIKCIRLGQVPDGSWVNEIISFYLK
ncbi:type I restriction-modification system subunit M N-terminal domain-containing protein [Hydrogenophaga soli]